MQSVSSKIWTRIVVSNSYDDNHYTIVIYSRLYEFMQENMALKVRLYFWRV